MFPARTCISNLLLRRQMHGNAEIVNNCKMIRNRNPRNLERLRIARKPDGYHLELPGRSYWHKLVILPSARHITAEIHHFENGPVITVSSKEWALKRYLYRLTDVPAYINVGRVLAQRCLQSGICEIYCNKELYTSEKAMSVISELEKVGISLTEPETYKPPLSSDKHRPEKPWETFE